MKVTTFNDRMSCLIRQYGSYNVARALGVDETLLNRWSNSDVVLEAPVRIDYTYFKYKHPEVNPLWLEKGIGEMFKPHPRC